MSLTEALRGVTAPLVTPFADGAVDHDALGRVVDHAVDGGVAGLFPNGTTGEFASLTAEERAAVVETTVAHADGRPVVAGVADTAVADVLAHAALAAEAGADALVVTPPYYHAATEPAGNETFLERIADEVPLPVLLYDIPSCTGNELAVDSVVRLAEHPNVIGMKDSTGDFTRFNSLLRETPDEFLLLQGFDAQLLPSLRVGADGGINALSNVVPEALSELYDEHDAERGKQLHESIGPLFDACLETGFAAGTKAALVRRGVLDRAETRPPATAVDPAVIEEPLEKALEKR